MGWRIRVHPVGEDGLMRLVPDSLAGRMIAVLLIGLTASHFFSMAIYTADRIEMSVESAGAHFSQQIASVVRMIDGTPPAWHQRMLQTMTEPSLGMSVTPERQYIGALGDNAQATLVKEHIQVLLDRTEAGDVIVQIVRKASQEGTNENGTPSTADEPSWLENILFNTEGRQLRASVRLSDGAWLNFRTHVTGTRKVWGGRAVLSISLMAVGVVLLSLWVIRKVTAPLRIFTAAAERLGRDVRAPPLIVAGPLELRHATNAFNRMQQQLKRLIDNRTEMLAAIAHDLRTPITLLRLRTEFVEDEVGREKMQSTLNDMEAMIASTLTFAREGYEVEESQDIDLSALVGSICDDIQDAGYSITSSLTDSLIFRGKPIALQRAVTNVIENAVKFADAASVNMLKTEQGVEISVADNGPGIPEQELEKVFLPFYRVEQSRNRKTGGAGLGLSIVQSIANEHGGEIALRNGDQGGLVATITLPRGP